MPHILGPYCIPLTVVASMKLGPQSPAQIQRNITVDGAWLVLLLLECSVPKGTIVASGDWKINLDRMFCLF